MTQAPPGPPGTPGTPGAPGPAARARRAGLAPLRDALGLFTVIPARAIPVISRDAAARMILWLPPVGALLVVPAGAVLLAVEAGGHSPTRRLLGAALAIVLLALLTGGLHLDGLADAADGLGSRRPPAEALAIMRRPDTGPFGAAALLFGCVIQITALASISPGWPAAAALAVAAVTGRVAVVLATGPGSPAARPDGLGALVAGATTARARAAAIVALLAAVAVTGSVVGGPYPAVRGTGAVLAGLLAADLLRRLARRRLGGLTGDVYGAQIEVAAAVVLLALALTT